MRPSHLRSADALAVLVALFLVAACGSDSDPVTPAPTLTIEAMTAQLAEIAGLDPPTARAEKTLLDLARQTCRVMAQGGGCADPLPSADAAAAAMPAPGLLSLLPAGSRGNGALMNEGPDVALPQPLGATCVWDVDNNGWTGSPPIFGDVPDDRTRFEGYETDPGGPVLPLQRTDDFSDVAPILQNTAQGPSSEVNVEVESRQVNGGTLVSLLLAGRIEPSNGNIVDLLMSGRSGSSAASALDYLFAIDQDRVANSMEIQDLLFISRLDASGNARFFLQKRNDPREAVEFVFTIGSGGLTIASGEVYVGRDRVATMSGNRGAPEFQLIDPNIFAEDTNLEFVYERLLNLDVRVIDLFFFGYCIGANTPQVCNAMRSRFNVG